MPPLDDDRTRSRPRRAARACATGPAMCSSAAASCAAMSRRRFAGTPIVVVEGELRDRLRRARLYRAGGRLARAASATASRSRPARSRPTWTATTSPRSSASRRRPCASCRPRSAAASARKLDLSVQPFVAVAAWHLERPGAHGLFAARVDDDDDQAPSRADRDARRRRRATATLARHGFHGRFQHRRLCLLGADGRQPRAGACLRPLFRAALPRAGARPIHTHLVPAGAFRGFGVPQAAIAQEQLYDELAERLGIDRLEFRIRNALDATTPTVTGQVLGDGVGIRACLEALRPHWARARGGGERVQPRRKRSASRRGVGVAGMWYGCGNTSLPNPSTIRVGLKRGRPRRAASGRGRYRPGLEHRHRADLRRRARRAARSPRSRLGRHRPDARLRQDLRLAPDLRHRQGGRACRPGAARARSCASPMPATDARISFDDGRVDRRGRRARAHASISPSSAADARGYVLVGGGDLRSADHAARRERPGRSLCGLRLRRASGRGRGRYASSARVKVLKITAAHDVGRAINPTLVEGQIEGGVAQGLGMALMEEFFPGRGENLHDYLIPTIGDMPPVEIDPDRGCLAGRALRRQGHRRAGADPDRAGDPQRHPSTRPACASGACPRRPTACAPHACGESQEELTCRRSLRPAAGGRQDPLRCLPGAVLHQARHARRLRPLRQSSTASWSASIRMSCSTARIAQGGGRRAVPPRAANGTARIVERAGDLRHRHRRRHDLSRLQAGALHRLVRGRRRRHGHRRDRGHLQLLRRQGEDRHRPASRARDARRCASRASRSAT